MPRVTLIINFASREPCALALLLINEILNDRHSSLMVAPKRTWGYWPRTNQETWVKKYPTTTK